MKSGASRSAIVLVGLVALVFSQVAAAGGSAPGQWDLRVQDGHVQVASVGAGVDSVGAEDNLAGTVNWFFVIDDSDLSVTNPAITVDSGYPASAFTGLGAASFPVTVTQPSLGPGQSFFSNPLAQFGVTTIPVTMTTGFDSSRSVAPAAVPVGGGDQQVTVSVTPQTTGPDYKVSVGDSPDATVTTVSGPPNLDQGESLNQLPSEFDLNNAVAGKTYTFTFSDHVPNPYGIPWPHTPFVSVNGGAESISCCSGPSDSIDFADPTLDGGTPGRGHVAYSVDQTVNNWAIDNGSFNEVQYQANDAHPTMPAPTLTASPTTYVQGAPVTLGGTGVPGATINLFDGAAAIVAPAPLVQPNGTWTATRGLIVGTNVLTATETLDGLTSTASAPVTVSVEPPAPVISGPASAIATISPATVTLNGTGFYGSGQSVPIGATVKIFEGSNLLGSVLVASDSSWSLPVLLSVGTHTLTATQTLAGQTGPVSAPFTVTVLDTKPPVISGLPGNLTVSASSAAGAVVTFPLPTALDAIDGPRPVTCTPAPGSTFAMGVTTTVTCTSSDTHGNTAAASFTVTVLVTASALTELTVEEVQSSAKYQELNAVQRALATTLIRAVSGALANVGSHVPPALRPTFLALYSASLQPLLSGGYLTQAQADQLKQFAAQLFSD